MKVTSAKELSQAFEGKKVLFITTKNIDYLRNTQELDVIGKGAKELKQVYSNSKCYPLRLVELFFRLIFMGFSKYDEIFIGFAPQLILPFFAWKISCPVSIDFFISMYDTLIHDRKKFKDGSFIAKLCHRLDRRTLKLAHRVICDTKAHGAYFAQEFDIEKEKLQVLYLQADEKIFYPQIKQKPSSLADQFVVLYFGSILPLQGVEIILDAMNALKDEKFVYFILIGPVKKNTYTGSQAKFIHWLSQEELADYIAFSDLCLAGHFNGEIEKAKRTIPGKAYIYESMEKPMILGDALANREIFTEDERHFFVKQGDEKLLSQKILKARNQLKIMI